MGTAEVLSSPGHHFHCCKARLQHVCSVPLARSSSGCSLLNLAACLCAIQAWEPWGKPSGVPGWVHRAAGLPQLTSFPCLQAGS